MPWKPAFPSRFRKGTVAACLGALVLLLTATQGFSKLPAIVHSSLAIPYTVDWESIRFEKNGSSSIEMYGTSFSHNAGELVLSTITPGHPFETFIRQTLDTIGLLIFDFTRPFQAKAEQRRRAASMAFIKNGCVDGPVVGRETILGYSTVAIQDRSPQERITLWRAPALSCFPLRITVEIRQPDGAYRLVSKKEARRVHWTGA